MADPRWLEVSFVVNGELAEALSEVLGRFVEGGVAVESNVRYNDAEDEGTPYGPVRIYGYLPVNESLEENRRKMEESIWYLGRIQPLPDPVYTPIEDQDWMNSWKANYKPIEIGKNMMIVPAWMNPDTKGRIPLRIDPSMAFGTGTHPTTQLCLVLIEKYLTPRDDVLDVGCGSGILSIAAIKLGANAAYGVDIDPLSVKASYENADLNDATNAVLFKQGSVAEVLSDDHIPHNAPLVVANILAPVIIRLMDAGLHQLVSPGGMIILSGILDHQADDVIRACQEKGLQLVEIIQSQDWVALALKA